MIAERAARVRGAMGAAGVEVLLLSVGADLPWLTGYTAMPLERLTMLVLPSDAEPTLVVAELEAPRVPGGVLVRAWSESEDPVAIVAGLVGHRRSIAIGDRTWATFVLGLQAVLPGRRWTRASALTGPLRAVKDAAEIDALAVASAAADRVATSLLAGRIPLTGRTEAAVSADIGCRLLDEGHQRVNFAIVGSGPNGASPHHAAGDRVIEPGDPVVCDFGGTLGGYCSDITRTVVAGGREPGAELTELYRVLQEAQAAGVAAARVGATCEDVDGAARSVIAAAGFGARFIHRTGHGIGLEEHEDPYVVAGNRTPLTPGHAFSVEPGIYLPGRFGARIEDIVVVTEAAPRPLNLVSHDLTVVDA